MGLHLGGVILMNLGGQGEKWCWCSGWLRVAEGLILKVVTGKEVGGWSKGRPWVCSIQTNTVIARDTSTDHPVHCLCVIFKIIKISICS